MPQRKVINLCTEGVVDPYIIFDIDDQITYFKPDVNYHLLLVMIGVFPSVNKARKQILRDSIPPGYTDFRINGCEVYIWNPSDPYFFEAEDDPLVY